MVSVPDEEWVLEMVPVGQGVAVAEPHLDVVDEKLPVRLGVKVGLPVGEMDPLKEGVKEPLTDPVGLEERQSVGEKVTLAVGVNEAVRLVLTVRVPEGQVVGLSVRLPEPDRHLVGECVSDCVGDILRVTLWVRVRDPEEEVEVDFVTEGVPVKHNDTVGVSELDRHSVIEADTLRVKEGDGVYDGEPVVL